MYPSLILFFLQFLMDDEKFEPQARDLPNKLLDARHEEAVQRVRDVVKRSTSLFLAPQFRRILN